jgi:hypothetical protein
MKEEDFIPRHADNSNEVSDEESHDSDKFYWISTATDIKNLRLYNKSYISISFLYFKYIVSNATMIFKIKDT